MAKAERVKNLLKESIRAREALYDFLDANPKGRGNEALNYLVKRGISSEIATETIKSYGQEHHTDTPHEHPHEDKAEEEVSGPAGADHMVQNNQKEKENVDVLPPKPVEDKPIIDENEGGANFSSDIGKVRGQSGEYLNAYKPEYIKDKHMAEEELKPEEIKAEEQEEEAVPEEIKSNGNGDSEKAEEDQKTDIPTNSSNCPDGQTFDSTLRKCVPNSTGSAGARGAPSVVKAVSDKTGGGERYSRPRGGRINADIKSEKKRVAEYYKKLDRLEALRNLKVADARIAAKEKFLKEKRLDRLIRTAKEGAKPRASVVPRASVKAGESGVRKITAEEAEVHGPVKLMRDVASEKNVTPSYVWHVNKQNIFDNSNSRFLKEFDSSDNTKYNPVPSSVKKSAGEALAGPASGDFMRTMSEQVLVLPDGKVVTPIRQFCETKVLAPGTKEAFFYDFGPVTFADVTEGSAIGDSTTNIRSAGGAATPRGTKLTIGYTQLEESPIDIVAAANRSYALESVNDESVEVLSRAFNSDTAGSGDAATRKAKGGGVKTGRWVDESGVQITADGSGMTNLTFAGLVAAKGVIEDEGLDPSNLVTYTTGKAIRDLIFDPDLDSFISFSRPAIITEATVERIAGTNVVRSSAPAAGTQSGSSRSVMFVPNIAFGLVTGRDLTMEAQRRNEIQSIYLTGTQRIAGFVKNVEATCRISHT